MKYSLAAFYKEYIKEKLLKDFLKKGKIPSSNEIDEELAAVTSASSNFKNPLLETTNYLILNGEASSASKVNGIFQAIESDLNICIEALLDQEKKISNLYDSSFSKLSGLQNQISQLNQTVETLLFVSKNTDTHQELFYEKFLSLDMVNQAATTCNIDIKVNEVTLKASEQFPIVLSDSVDNITIVPEKNSAIVNSTDVGDMIVANIIKTNNKVWMHQLSSTTPLASASIDLIIRIPSLQNEINKMYFEPYAVDLKTQMNIEVSHSKDGLNWIYPDGEYKKRLDKTTTLNFKGLQSEYWRIRFTKFGNDGFFSNYYAYNFGLKSLMLFGKTYDKVSRLDLGYFYSKPIVFKNNVKVANFKVCENKPSNTSISYSVAPIHDSELTGVNDGTIPLNQLQYYKLDFTDLDNVTIDFLNVANFPVISNLALDNSINYKDRAQYDYCLNHLLGSTYLKGETTIMRNELNQAQYSVLGKEKVNKEKFFGWQFDGTYYYAYIQVESREGVNFDLGSTTMYVNNTKTSGKVFLQQGIHFIVTHRDNWLSLDLTNLPLEADERIDYLYPYNHKYLIEGLDAILYGRDLTVVIDGAPLIDIIDPDKVYRTPKRCWGYKMKEVTFDEFTSKSENELDVFSYKIDNTNQERIVAKSNEEIGLINSETFSIITKLHSAENIKGLIFKAVLETSDNKVTPVLTEYLVKIK